MHQYKCDSYYEQKNIYFQNNTSKKQAEQRSDSL